MVKKGLLAALCALLLLVLAPVPGASAAGLTTEQKFEALKREGIFTGYADGSAHLSDPMTREQFAAVLYRLWDLREEASAQRYSDVLRLPALRASRRFPLDQDRRKQHFDVRLRRMIEPPEQLLERFLSEFGEIDRHRRRGRRADARQRAVVEAANGDVVGHFHAHLL